MQAPSASYSLTVRLEIVNKPGMLGRVTSAIGKAGGDIGAIDLVVVGKSTITRDITFKASDERHGQEVVDGVRAVQGVKVVNVSDRTFLMHLGGKIEVRGKMSVKTRDDLSMAYTPGVARVCMAIHADPEKAYALTIKQNAVAVVTDGTAVLGLGDIGPSAAQPVMEGKALIFKEFAGVDAFPVCLATKDADEIVAIVKAIAPVFGGINLEDISAPRCFDIETRLQRDLEIPVFHDDQHGTAVVVLAALLNALKIVKKRLSDARIVFTGAGASGIATAKLLMRAGAQHIIACGRAGPARERRDEARGRARARGHRVQGRALRGIHHALDVRRSRGAGGRRGGRGSRQPHRGRPPAPARAGRGCAGVAVAGEGDGPARGVLRAVRCAPRLAAPLHPEPRGPRGGRARAGPLPVRGLGGDRGRA